MKNKILLIGVVILLVGGLANLYVVYTNLPDAKLNMHVNVTDYQVVGFNNNNDSLWFGSMMPTGFGIRHVELTNDAKYPQKINLVPTGTIAKYITFSENDFILEPEEFKDVEVTVTPTGAATGNHTGALLMYFRKV